jgi:hypothetical protein
MKQVLARRDDNWKKLQQYILDERETTELRDGSGAPVFGMRHEYAWYIRDGFFVRSPVRIDGVAIGEAERRKYEEEYLGRAKERDERAADPETPPADVNALIRQTRQPQFVSSAYFLRFKFDEGTYALAGRERFADRDVLRIEYYPTNLFADAQGRRASRRQRPEAVKKEMTRLLNKAALVTLWVEPERHQIVKYTLENINLDFLPVAWLVRVDAVKASMTMSQPFPDVWLPHDVDVRAEITMATGTFGFRRTVDYYDYRQADVTSKVSIPR